MEFNLWNTYVTNTAKTWLSFELLTYIKELTNVKEVFTDINASAKLTHWGRVTHICVSKLTIIVSDNGLAPGRRQAIIQTNAGIVLIGPWGTNFSEILSEFHTFSFKKIHLKLSSVKLRPFDFGLNVLSYGQSPLTHWYATSAFSLKHVYGLCDVNCCCWHSTVVHLLLYDEYHLPIQYVKTWVLKAHADEIQ